MYNLVTYALLICFACLNELIMRGYIFFLQTWTGQPSNEFNPTSMCAYIGKYCMCQNKDRYVEVENMKEVLSTHLSEYLAGKWNNSC